MVIARLLNHLTSGESILGEAETIVILLAVTLIVALTSRRLHLSHSTLSCSVLYCLMEAVADLPNSSIYAGQHIRRT